MSRLSNKQKYFCLGNWIIHHQLVAPWYYLVNLEYFPVHIWDSNKCKLWKCGILSSMYCTYRSNEIATRVKILMFILRQATNGQNWHINAGRSHRCTMDAWNWNGIAKSAMVTSANAKLVIYIFVTVCIRRDTITT